MKTYHELAPQIPITHRIWVGDDTISLAEHLILAQLCKRIWHHDENGFVQQTENGLEFKPVSEREQLRLILSARTLDSEAVKWINENSFI